MSGLAFDNASGKLYGTTYSGNLYTIDPVTGTATLVGPITGENNVARIAFDQIDGTLYGVTVSNQLVSIDIATLVATQVAQFPALEQIYSMDFISLSQRQTQSVPTINNWGMIIFMVIAGLGAVFYLRRSKRA
jgi:outer membrane protein assembly factor BamB